MTSQTFWQWKLPSASYRMHYIEKGTGPRHILLLHGFAAHSYTWKFVIESLAQAGYHVWALDLIGFGFSDKPLDVHYGLDLFIAQIEAFMEEMHLSSAAIIGHSMGGGLALAMALFHSARVQSLVLMDALVYPIKLPIYFALARVLGNLSKPFFGRMATKRVLKDVMYDHKKISEEQIAAYTSPLSMPGGKEALIKSLQNFTDHELWRIHAHLDDIKVPTLIIWGEKDKWMPSHYHQRLSHALPHAHKVIIPNCGHVSPEESPQECGKAILEFYKQLEEGRERSLQSEINT